jgi:hypothetical protein
MLAVFRKVWYKCEFVQVGSEYNCSYLHMYSIHIREFSWNTECNTLELDSSQHDWFVSRVISQQYSSTFLASLLFHSCYEKFGVDFKIVIPNILFFKLYVWNCISWRGVGGGVVDGWMCVCVCVFNTSFKFYLMTFSVAWIVCNWMWGCLV